MTEKKERIAKMMAAAGCCSRREAERRIAEGRVTVNGQVLKTPACLVGPADTVMLDGKSVGAKQVRRVWCYHKPAGVMTTNRDPQGRPTVFEGLPASLPRVVTVGRLDFNSEGLLLLTTDGELARELELPTKGWKRRYRVRVHGKMTDSIIARLAQGVTVQGVRYAPCQVEVERVQGSNTWLLITLTEGKNREIRRLMSFFGLEVTRLIRVSYGPFQLGNLEAGQVREVPAAALKALL